MPLSGTETPACVADMERAVLDTNILISSAVGGALVFILEQWDAEKFTLKIDLKPMLVLDRPGSR